ncbi:MAG: hypothetical protein J0I00_08555 [Burkholderiales bacterium]|uniref:Uncharacterized protein n=1 Tax=Ottowia pentelensis TaxID=511108 RepID=A0ABV6PSS2_9BURK|nr:hypothetical protein [Burkholderiales bacterium]MBS0403107.1 hypothetical protein [Pseudomonadota bacterium]
MTARSRIENGDGAILNEWLPLQEQRVVARACGAARLARGLRERTRALSSECGTGGAHFQRPLQVRLLRQPAGRSRRRTPDPGERA